MFKALLNLFKPSKTNTLVEESDSLQAVWVAVEEDEVTLNQLQAQIDEEFAKIEKGIEKDYQ